MTTFLQPSLHPVLLKVGIPSSFFLGLKLLEKGAKCMCSVLLCILSFCFIVPDPTPITGMQASVVPRAIASSGSDVFVCEEARDTPAVGSDPAPVLADEGVQTSRTQHGRDAIGLEPSVVYNDWEKCIVE